MENNSKIFDKKMRELKRMNNQNEEDKYNNYKEEEGAYDNYNYTESQNESSNVNQEKYIQQLKNEISYKDSLIEELREKLNQEGDFENIQTLLEDKKMENELLKKENKALVKELESYGNDYNISSNYNIGLNDSKRTKAYDKLQNECEVLRQNLNAAKKEIEKLNEKNLSLVNELSELKRKMNEKNENFSENSKVASKYENPERRTGRYEKFKGNINKDVYDGFDYFPSEHNIAANSSEITNLDSDLNNLLKERDLIENEINRMPTRPRNLNEIRTKRGKTEMLEQIEEKINQIKRRIRQFNNGL
ncbi:MAG: hypothetical protein MJ252_01295 [archaeon]|nr:hypothetical protein [archaeon]